MIAHVLLDGHLIELRADALTEIIHRTDKNSGEHFGQKRSGVLRIEVASVEQDGLFDEFALAFTVVRSVHTLHQLLGFMGQPNGALFLGFSHSNTPFYITTPVFSLETLGFSCFTTASGTKNAVYDPCHGTLKTARTAGRSGQSGGCYAPGSFSCLSFVGFPSSRKAA